MRHPAFLAGDYDTGFIERHKAELTPPRAAARRSLDDAALAAALHASRENATASAAPGHRHRAVRLAPRAPAALR